MRKLQWFVWGGILALGAGLSFGCGGTEEEEPEEDAGVDGAVDVDAGGEEVVTIDFDDLTDDNSIFTGVVIEDGRITLSPEAVVSEVIWIANSHEGSISKIDTATHEELGRYYTGPAHIVTVSSPDPLTGLCSDGSEPAGDECRIGQYESFGNWDGPGQNPSRTSVDAFGNAYVANRAFSGYPSATKIMNHCEARGADLVTWAPDGDEDLANDPPPLPFFNDDRGTPSPWDDELEWQDDCIAWTTLAMIPELDAMDSGTPGDPTDDTSRQLGQLGRGIVLQMREVEGGLFHTFVWMASHYNRRYYEIDGETGELTKRVIEFPGCTPYGAAIDRAGVLWSACLSGMIGRAETSPQLVVTDPADDVPDDTAPGTARHCLDAFGLEVDGVTCINGQDISLGGQSSYGITVAPPLHPADPPVRVYASYGTITELTPAWTDPEGVLHPDMLAFFNPFGTFTAGVAVDKDGILWAYGESGTLARVNPTKVDVDTLTGVRTPRPDSVTIISTGRGGRGVGVATDGMIWAVNWGVGGDVTLIQPHPAPDLDGDLDPDDVAASEYLAGSCCSEIENSYTYSDMTGYQLSNVMEPLGDLRFFLPLCEEGVTTWGDVGVEGAFPEGTSLSVHVRLVAGLADLQGNEDWIELSLEDGSPVIDAAHPEGGVFVMPELGGLGTLGMRVTLRTEDQSREVRPTVSEMWVQRACQ